RGHHDCRSQVARLHHSAALQHGQFDALSGGQGGFAHDPPSLPRCNLPLWGWNITTRSGLPGPATAAPAPAATRRMAGTTSSRLTASMTSPARATGPSTGTP